MNERIRELAEQAGFHFDEYNEPTQRKAEKFAELIVRECATLADTAEPYKANDLILKHFRVKEPKGWVCPKCGTDRTKYACPRGNGAAVDGSCPMFGVAQ